MLSILIPVYNYDCSELVAALDKQAVRLNINYEILVADDASEESFRQRNRVINERPNCRYIELPENVGRSRIRNILASEAQYGYLLFMDCDGVVVRDDFLKDYVACIPDDKVVCGGIVHPDRLPDPSVSLRYTYEKQAEKRFTAEKRRQNPYGEFRSFNFMIAKDILDQHPFDESIVDYGFEDTLLGKELKAAGIPVRHIDNPLMNGDIEPNEKYLAKMKRSLHTLYLHRSELEGYSGVLTLYNKLQKFHATGVVKSLYRVWRPAIMKNLTGQKPSLWCFKLYKIGCYCEIAAGN